MSLWDVSPRLAQPHLAERLMTYAGFLGNVHYPSAIRYLTPVFSNGRLGQFRPWVRRSNAPPVLAHHVGNIGFLRPKLEMVRIDAGWVVAKVQNDGLIVAAVRQSNPVVQLVCDAMRSGHSLAAIIIHDAIAVDLRSAEPRPACFRSALYELLSKALLKRLSRLVRVYTFWHVPSMAVCA